MERGAAVEPDRTAAESFTEFVGDVEARLRQALTASLGPDLGRDAAAEALAYGWEHWERIAPMENSVGYLYRVGQRWGRRAARRRRPILPPVDADRFPWVEPALPDAMRRLPERQRVVVLLLHSYEWTMSEVAELMGVSKGTVQSYADRALRSLRRRLGVSE